MPKEHAESLAKLLQKENNLEALIFLMHMCQFYKLEDADIEQCRNMVSKLADDDDFELNDALRQAYAARIIAAAMRNTSLAGAIGHCMQSASARASEIEHLEMIVRVLLQAAASHQCERVWMHWLDT